MQFFRRHWYDVGAVVAVFSIIALVLLWGRLDVLQRLLLLNFIVLLIHQYEEYGWPGGEPAIMNMVLQRSTIPDRFPLNQNSAMVINVLAAYCFYLIPVFFPRVIWLGLAPVLFGMLQFIVHGIVTNKKMKSLYNPGVGRGRSGAHAHRDLLYLPHPNATGGGDLGLGGSGGLHVRLPVRGICEDDVHMARRPRVPIQVCGS